MRWARAAPAADAAFEDDVGENQSIQDEIPPVPRRRGRGRGRVRPQPVAAPEVEQEPLVEPEAPEVDPACSEYSRN